MEFTKEKFYNYNIVTSTLNNIFNNHNDRIMMFDRIPERNRILGRKSTDREITYLNAIY